eukprot:COSAG04_NODE_11170_length_726_cov_1.046252_1_plen_139_part_00
MLDGIHHAAGGYGGIGGDSPNLNCDCLAAPGLDEVLCYGWVGVRRTMLSRFDLFSQRLKFALSQKCTLRFLLMQDNGGPPPVSTINKNWALLAKAFPNADAIVPSTFDAFCTQPMRSLPKDTCDVPGPQRTLHLQTPS